MRNIRRFYRLRELYEANYNKPGIYGRGRVWANAWDVFRRTPSRGSRGRRAAVDFVVFGVRRDLFRVFVFFSFFFPSNAHGLLLVWGCLASFTSLQVMRQDRGSQVTEAVFCLWTTKPFHNEAKPRERIDRGRFFPLGHKKSLHTGVRTGCHCLFSLSLRLSVYLSVCVTFDVFTDWGSCTRAVSTNSGSMEAGECGRTRGTFFITCRLEVVAVVGLTWVSWCVFGWARFVLVLQVTTIFFFNSCTSTRPMAARDPANSQRRYGKGAPTVSQSAHLELAPTYSHQVYRLVPSHLRNMPSTVDQ